MSVSPSRFLPALIGTLAAVLGTLSIVAGSKVVLGLSTPEPPVLLWLVIYNICAGFASAFAALLVFRGKRLAIPAARVILGAHTTVLAVLVALRLLEAPVATRSISAMALRAVVWLVLAFLIPYAIRRNVETTNYGK